MSDSVSYTEKELFSLTETVADIARSFALAEFWPADSREFTRLCHVWALEFEKKNKGREWDGEYIEEVEAFFDAKYADESGLTLANPFVQADQRGRAQRHDQPANDALLPENPAATAGRSRS